MNVRRRYPNKQKQAIYIATLDGSSSGACALQVRDDHIHFGQLCDHLLVWLQSGDEIEGGKYVTDSLTLVNESCLC
jgi:hypothetical protein